MDLFQSGREPWPDPYAYIWKTYAKMSQWFQDLPSSILPSTKSFFELELLYSYVYILSPSPRIPHIQVYAQRLIFEHCIAYATTLLGLISQTSTTTKPPVTFYDAMRVYMTGRQFVDVLSRNLDALLDPMPAIPPPAPMAEVTSEDPLAPAAQTSPPPFPSSSIPEGQSALPDPTTRAINTINDFSTILSRFGLRFGFTHWRDRFQRESGALLAQLYQRASTPTHSPQNQMLPHPTYTSQSWGPNTAAFPQTTLSQQPTTPPAVYPPQPSPFSTSPYNNHQQMPDWTTTPSPQPLPEFPQPSEGRMRHAMVYGPGLPPPPQLTRGSSDGQDGRFM
jgi:hypothetical protein